MTSHQLLKLYTSSKEVLYTLISSFKKRPRPFLDARVRSNPIHWHDEIQLRGVQRCFYGSDSDMGEGMRVAVFQRYARSLVRRFSGLEGNVT